MLIMTFAYSLHDAFDDMVMYTPDISLSMLHVHVTFKSLEVTQLSVTYIISWLLLGRITS